MATVTLHPIPQKADELEEYVAALFQSSGHFVEKRVIEREVEGEVLELDAVATSYESGLPVMTLVEAKSGGWGFADLFKLCGWMQYLDINAGAFFASKAIDKSPNFIQKKLQPLGVRIVHLSDFANAVSTFNQSGFPALFDAGAMNMWRLSYWAERQILKNLRDAQKANPTQRSPAAILEYLHLINNGIFFTTDIRQRLQVLYAAYQSHPKLALAVALEVAGKPYDPSAIDPTNAHIGQALRTGQHPLIQYAFYAEQRARLAILKAAIDHECAVEAGLIAAPKTAPASISRSTLDLSYWLLPQTFKTGLDQLKSHGAFKRYALFWQVFLWGFGGFYLKARRDEEFAHLAHHTGLSVEDVPRALTAFDILFPLDSSGSWLVNPGPTEMVTVKMMPFPLQGVGAIHRQRLYNVDSYGDLNYSYYTTNDLTRRHNTLIHLLAHP